MSKCERGAWETTDENVLIPPHLNPLLQWRRGENPFSPLASTRRETGWDEGIHNGLGFSSIFINQYSDRWSAVSLIILMFRIGNGYDVHRLVEGRKLILGGVEIPHTLGLLGHSDADALLHAICDAILGALGSEDIGKYFPDTDPKWKGASSLILLKQVGVMCADQGFAVSNIDSIIAAEKPKIAPHIEGMKKNIASVLGIDPTQVNVKATTTETLGFVGREEGMAATSVVLLQKGVGEI